ncbi:MAG: hypothetical protein ACK5MD_04680 [Flavobacteriales bacterium]
MKNRILILLILSNIVSCQESVKDLVLEAKNFQSDLMAFYNGEESPIRLENKKKLMV